MNDPLTRDEIETLFAAARKRVRVSCDEAHAHTALDGCLSPMPGESEDAVTICKLAEHCVKANKTFDELAAILNAPPKKGATKRG